MRNFLPPQAWDTKLLAMRGTWTTIMCLCCRGFPVLKSDLLLLEPFISS